MGAWKLGRDKYKAGILGRPQGDTVQADHPKCSPVGQQMSSRGEKLLHCHLPRPWHRNHQPDYIGVLLYV